MSFILAESQDGSIPRVVERSNAAGQAYNKGALLLVDGSNNFAECGADPAAIACVAEAGAGADTANFVNVLGVKGFPPGKNQGTYIKDQVFSARYVGTLPAADGGSYGVVRDTDGLWKVDFAETVNTRLKLVGRMTGSPENQPRVKVKFLDANVQVV
jgi:hypothetical protein